MRARSVLGKSAAAMGSLVLLSGYVYLRSAGDAGTSSDHEAAAHRKALMPGPKSGPVWARSVGEPDEMRGAAADALSKSARTKNTVIMPGSKSTAIFPFLLGGFLSTDSETAASEQTHAAHRRSKSRVRRQP